MQACGLIDVEQIMADFAVEVVLLSRLQQELGAAISSGALK